MIEPTKWTHLNYAFALIDRNTFEIAQMNDFDTELYPVFTGLKEQNPALQVYISVGGWSAGGQVFSDMTATAANRAAFISSAITFMKTYAFDGIDIDWEYPVAADRGGNAADFDNYVTFVKELRAACGTAYGITVTLPSSYWYMQNFDIVNLEPYLDWFNIMTYDIHGTWDGNNPYTKAVVQAHTNLTEIDEALDLLWRNDIDSSKVVLGLAFYGRSFTLKDSSCSNPGCPFASGGTPGRCTQTSGILSDSEIQALISQGNIVPTLDSDAGVKYMTWNDDQWVSYDDAQTFAMKVNYANKLCLGGTMVWALDLDSAVNTTSIDNLNSMDSLNFSPVIKAATVSSNAATLGIFWTPCLPPGSQECPDGYDAIVWGHGKVFDADLAHLTGEGCHGGGNGSIVSSALHPMSELENSHIGGQKSGCKSGKYAPVCCQSVTATTSGWCYARTIDHILSGSLASRDNTLDVGSYRFGGTSSTKKVKRTTSSNQWTGTKALSKHQKLLGSFGCSGSYYLPLNAIPVDVPARLVSSYIGGESWSVSLSPTATPSATKKNQKTIYVPSHVTTTTYSTQIRWCDGAKYPQACYHYSSVAQYSTWQKPTCAAAGGKDPVRPLVSFYDSTAGVTQHNSIWSKDWITKTYVNPNGKRVKPNCQRDEWPPAHFQQGHPEGYIRLLPGSQNGGVANSGLGGWKGFCKYPPEKQVKVEGGPIQVIGDIVYVTSIMSSITTINVMDYSFFNMGAPQADEWLLTDNPCYPSTLTQDPGFALLTWDPYYGGVPPRLPYSEPPTAQYTSGKTKPSKRDWFSETLILTL
ncbi:glycosyl hydrolases family 18-domain-containing protein [Aspergillus navahoensis]